jgi:hypothetical protein
MIDPNKGVSTEKLELLRQESYERMCTQLKTAIEQKLTDFQMTWDDLANCVHWEDVYCAPGEDHISGLEVKGLIGDCGGGRVTLSGLNDIAHSFSAEVYVIFRPRYPWIAT